MTTTIQIQHTKDEMFCEVVCMLKDRVRRCGENTIKLDYIRRFIMERFGIASRRSGDIAKEIVEFFVWAEVMEEFDFSGKSRIYKLLKDFENIRL